MAGIPWTDQEIEILKQLSMAGKTTKVVCAVLGRSDDSVNSKASQLGLSLAGKRPHIDFEAFKRIMKAESEMKCL